MEVIHQDQYRMRVLKASKGFKEWNDSAGDQHYFVPTSDDQVRELQGFLKSLPDGSYLPVRGRDFVSLLGNATTEWDYGVAVKNGNRLFFVYQTGETESFPIHNINFQTLVHFGLETTNNIFDTVRVTPSRNNDVCPANRVVMINHGWSNVVGPDYPLIRALETVALRKGWKTIVPDFRPSYKFSEPRARSERVRIIYEE